MGTKLFYEGFLQFDFNHLIESYLGYLMATLYGENFVK